MQISEVLLGVLSVIVPASLWYLRTAIPKWIEASYAAELEKLKSLLQSQLRKADTVSGKIVPLYDEVLQVIGEIKTADFAVKMGVLRPEDLMAKWLNEKVYKLACFEETWWPYFTADLRSAIEAFRVSLDGARKYDRQTDTTAFDKSSFWQAADDVQELIRGELEAIYGSATIQ